MRTPARDPTRARRVRRFRTLAERLLAPLAGTIAVWLLAGGGSGAAIVALLAFTTAALMPAPKQSWASLLTLMKSPIHLIRPLVALGFLVAIQLATGVPRLDSLELLLVFGVTAVTGLAPHLLMPRSWSAERAVRLAVIGSSRSARELAQELRLAGVHDYEVVGRIAVEWQQNEEPASVPTIGALSRLKELVAQHGIELLVMTGEVPRYLVFDEVSRTCLDLPVRMCELSGFCEEVFGHVPVAEINASWFQYILHPRYRAVTPVSKRALDVILAALAGLAFLPPLLLFALLIRRDGGPVLFTQLRIGEGGRPFTVYKLRTMRVRSDTDAVWAVENDDRVTRVGRFLRYAHLDEIPQLINVIRGEMSLVGPRPEQPEFVELLEDVIPFYQRRHLLKPGITGWAQVRCGYAGSELGTAWKLSHDLYYLKHRSLAFDLAILAETSRTFFDHQHAVEPPTTIFVHGTQPRALEGQSSATASDSKRVTSA